MLDCALSIMVRKEVINIDTATLSKWVVPMTHESLPEAIEGVVVAETPEEAAALAVQTNQHFGAQPDGEIEGVNYADLIVSVETIHLATEEDIQDVAGFLTGINEDGPVFEDNPDYNPLGFLFGGGFEL